MNQNFKGMYAVTVTPFKEDGSFDFEKTKGHLDWLIEQGLQGICLLGATGEYQSISIEEHKAFVKEIVPYIKDRVSVIVGATREQADDVVDLVKNIKACGADAAMVLPSPYCHPSQDEVVEHYRYIMERTEFPIMVYNNPGSCGISFERETFRKLMALPYTAMVKESSGSIQVLRDVIEDAPENVSVFCGCDNLAFESFADGACGMICMLANVAPRSCVELFDAIYEQHDLARGWEIYKRLLPGFDALESFPKPVQALKYLTNWRTGNGGFCRRPRLELTDAEKAYVVELMKADQLY